MFKSKLVLFFISFVCSFFLVLGIFGNRGYLYNKSLKQQLIVLVKQAEKLGVEVNSLTEKTKSLETEEGIRDAAMKLGYYVRNDNVYIFEDPQIQTGSQVENEVSQIKFYQPLSSFYCILIACFFALVITFCSLIWTIKKENLNDFEQKQSGDYTDSFSIDG